MMFAIVKKDTLRITVSKYRGFRPGTFFSLSFFDLSFFTHWRLFDFNTVSLIGNREEIEQNQGG